jgi:hypothetical protein
MTVAIGSTFTDLQITFKATTYEGPPQDFQSVSLGTNFVSTGPGGSFSFSSTTDAVVFGSSAPPTTNLAGLANLVLSPLPSQINALDSFSNQLQIGGSPVNLFPPSNP